VEEPEAPMGKRVQMNDSRVPAGWNFNRVKEFGEDVSNLMTIMACGKSPYRNGKA
jgi:hypothetical protein